MDKADNARTGISSKKSPYGGYRIPPHCYTLMAITPLNDRKPALGLGEHSQPLLSEQNLEGSVK